MTIREAIASSIEPYSLSDEAVDKAAMDAFDRFGGNSSVDTSATYAVTMKKPCGYAAMLLLRQCITLQAENIGGISNTYKKDVEEMIKGIAKDIGVNPELVLDTDGDNVVTYCPVW